MGAPIFQGYYMSFENGKTLGIKPHLTSTKTNLALGTIPVNVINPNY
jgi:hypothetical protein